jgi:alkylhydroperoxidase family enzyme
MPLVSYVDDTHSDPDVLQVLARVSGRRGVASLLVRALANSPGALRAWDVMSAEVGSGSRLGAPLKELVILRVAQRLQNTYEWRRHVPKALDAGVERTVIEALGDWERLPLPLDDRSCAALALVDDLLADFDVSGETQATVQRSFAPGEAVDLVVAVAWYVLIGALIKSFGVEEDDDATMSGPDIPLPRAPR